MLPIGDRVTNEVDFTKIRQLAHIVATFFKVLNIDEVKRQVDLLKRLTAANTLDERDVIDGEVEVLELLQLAQVLHALNQIILQVKDLKMTTPNVEVLDLFNMLLMERQLFERVDNFLVMLGSLAHKFLRNEWHWRNTNIFKFVFLFRNF